MKLHQISEPPLLDNPLKATVIPVTCAPFPATFFTFSHSVNILRYYALYCFIIVFAVQINKVCLQVTVEAVIGGSVVLPCSSAESKLELKEMFVFWRDKDSRIIYDLNEGTDSLKSQDPRYKNRVQTFPDEYKRGNFSIKLIHLTHADAGQFNCYITPSDEQETNQQDKKTMDHKHN
ncbi:ICOS ligand [Labeo rohita]|uniref:ICOS ligand n=1 Tax=Labeo rohita TaxID=84645 RepID=A0ABQ8L8H1_LABRO|nr:ICOS ligand [Labeo rohita]